MADDEKLRGPGRPKKEVLPGGQAVEVDAFKAFVEEYLIPGIREMLSKELVKLYEAKLQLDNFVMKYDERIKALERQGEEVKAKVDRAKGLVGLEFLNKVLRTPPAEGQEKPPDKKLF